MISEQTEAKMAASRAARVSKQDKKHPMLINVEDGRLMPNVPLLRKNAKYRVFMGDPKTPLADRMRILETQGIRNRAAVVDSSQQAADAPEFDIGKAQRADLVKFALETYGATLDAAGDTHMNKLRAQVRTLARENGDLPGSEDDDPAS